MKIPAQAFAELGARSLSPGTLCMLKDCWALRVSDGAEDHGLLVLDGNYAGQVTECRSTLRAVGVVSPFAWFPAVSPIGRLTPEANWNRVLMFTSDGPVIVAKSISDWGESDLAFNLDGESVQVPNLGRSLGFDQWSIELCHEERPWVSLGTLLQIDGGAK